MLETVLAWLAAPPAPVTDAMGATLYWEWLVARLQEAGHTAQVADEFQVKLIWHARSKPDPMPGLRATRASPHGGCQELRRSTNRPAYRKTPCVPGLFQQWRLSFSR